MINEGQMTTREIQIQGLLDNFLQKNYAGNGFEGNNHLDEDTLTAFVEGNLSEREAKPATNHLIKCSFCRHITAELIKLDYAFADDTEVSHVAEAKPTKVSEVLGGILSRIFGSNDGAVFAHQESEDEDETKAKDNEEE